MITYRKPTIDEAKQIVLLEEDSLGETLGEDIISNLINGTDTAYVIGAFDGAKLVGYISANVVLGDADILNVCVYSDYRRKGIATAMFNKLFEDNKIRKCTLEVRSTNASAIALYKKFNFKTVSLRKSYYSNGDDAFLMERKSMIILAIESSCDETAMAIIEDGRRILSNVVYTQIDIHTLYGGVVPEVASREHIKKVTVVLDQSLKEANMPIDKIDYVAVTATPGLIGSLMVGINCAKVISSLYNKPLVYVNHLYGHIYANYLESDFTFPMIALVVSGGHTELVLMKDHFNFEILGETLDDAVGEAYDKVARVVNVGYPGGPILDKMANEGQPTYDLPHVKLGKDSYDFSFSGIKSAVINLYNKTKEKGETLDYKNLACSFQNSVVDILVSKTKKAALEYGAKHVIIAGGVSANKGLREAMEKEMNALGIKFTCPKMKYCTDNAAMIGAAAYFQIKTNNI